MGNLTPAKIKLSAVLLVVAVVSILSVYNFQKFKPNVSSARRAKEGEQAGIHLPSDLPIPLNSKELSTVQSTDNIQMNLESEEKSESIYNFYKNILLDKGWSIKSNAVTENGYVTNYQKDENELIISITRDNSINKSICVYSK